MEATGKATTTTATTATPPATPAAASAAREERLHGYRRQIIHAAEREFGKAGFTATPMNAIAATAGLSLATVYKSFAGKAEIWDALHRERMDALLAEVREADTGEPGLERLLTGLRRVFGFLAAHPAYLDMNLRAGGGWASSVEGAHGAQRTVWSSGLEVIAAGMRSAADRGELAGLDPRIAAGMAISALQVWLSEWVAAGRSGDPEALADDMTRRLRLMLTARA
ncbi:TetR family transcriptional regulator [Dietzia natronolimnaea]|uniref:TetR family transcriptional regulator n=1 Tax=Dietzia natronolimnaea TaxID=161920 RepID=A0A2A2WTA5_9ACTN|nr:TetR/AcrR family transcriptional regulator [Dietzia natronolimnaea]PAY24273.1 TetR family transcriptional regulator [Dietzia natronolimnaea]